MPTPCGAPIVVSRATLINADTSPCGQRSTNFNTASGRKRTMEFEEIAQDDPELIRFVHSQLRPITNKIEYSKGFRDGYEEAARDIARFLRERRERK
jgi:hypothetical protein